MSDNELGVFIGQYSHYLDNLESVLPDEPNISLIEDIILQIRFNELL